MTAAQFEQLGTAEADEVLRGRLTSVLAPTPVTVAWGWISCFVPPPGGYEVAVFRFNLAAIVYLVVGVVVAANRHYLATLHAVRQFGGVSGRTDVVARMGCSTVWAAQAL
jgi:hypothetical protein